MDSNLKPVTNDVLGAALKQLERKYKLDIVSGPYWKHWCLNGKLIATYCDSPYPGPDYGVKCTLDTSLLDTVVVQRSRPLTYTEVHLINERLRHPNKPKTRLLPEIEEALARTPSLKSVHRYSFELLWGQEVRLT